jgi:molybdopterin converting factor small subunit
LITLKLLGSIKKYCGKDNIIINEKEIKLSNIFSVLNQNISNSQLIDKENLLILINGVDLSVCGTDQKIKSGDIVTVANLIHGG